MTPSELIEAYLDDTVRLLPRRLREDVATELRSLLHEDLQARAEGLGRPADEALALSLVRDYGRPNEVAARYSPPLSIIDPSDSTSFLRAAFIGACAVILFGSISHRLPSQSGSGANLIFFGVPFWLGLLAIYFGAKSWIRRRFPASLTWEPRDRDRANSVGIGIMVPFASFVVILYAAPMWVLDKLTGGRLQTSWAAYTPDFQRSRLPLFIGLLAGLLVLISYVGIHGRWTRHTRRISVGCNLALSMLCLILAADGGIFQSSEADRVARDVLALVAVFYVPLAAAELCGEIGRLDRSALAKAV